MVSFQPAALLSLILAVAITSPEAGAVVHIDYAWVGNPGNAADTAVMEIDGSTGYGAVSTGFAMARTETTLAQYTAFLNAVAATDTYGLYHPEMGLPALGGITRSGSPGGYQYLVTPGSENKPVSFVSWFDAARFCNWLHNGQLSGAQNASTTEDGAYSLNGATSGTGIVRNQGATVWIPSENEWYKAAYHDPDKNGGAGGYWSMPNRSDSVPGNTIGQAGALNFYDEDYTSWPGSALTPAGAFGAASASPYGLHDMGGNVFEWNEAVISSSRGLRGGSWDFPEDYLASTSRNEFDPAGHSHNIGFRIAGTGTALAAVPEPTAATLATAALAVLVTRRRRAFRNP